MRRPLPLGAIHTVLIRGLGLALIVYAVGLVAWDSRVYETKVLLDSGKVGSALHAFARAREIAPPAVTAEAWFSRELLRKTDSVPPGSLDEELYYSLRVAAEQEEELGNATILLAAKLVADHQLGEATAVLRGLVLEFPNWELPRRIQAQISVNRTPGKD